jgi:hypothetical protein
MLPEPYFIILVTRIKGMKRGRIGSLRHGRKSTLVFSQCLSPADLGLKDRNGLKRRIALLIIFSPNPFLHIHPH